MINLDNDGDNYKNKSNEHHQSTSHDRIPTTESKYDDEYDNGSIDFSFYMMTISNEQKNKKLFIIIVAQLWLRGKSSWCDDVNARTKMKRRDDANVPDRTKWLLIFDAEISY